MDYLKVRFPCCSASLNRFGIPAALDSRCACVPLQCMDESKAPTEGLRMKECSEWLEDYKECLHRGKAVRASPQCCLFQCMLMMVHRLPAMHACPVWCVVVLNASLLARCLQVLREQLIERERLRQEKGGKQ